MPTPRHKPTEASRAEVMALAGYGVRQDEIALYIGVTEPTLRKYYKQELKLGKVKANAAVARALYKAGVEDGNITALIFWMKAQAGWSEKARIEVSTDDPLELILSAIKKRTSKGAEDD